MGDHGEVRTVAGRRQGERAVLVVGHVTAGELAISVETEAIAEIRPREVQRAARRIEGWLVDGIEVEHGVTDDLAAGFVATCARRWRGLEGRRIDRPGGGHRRA